MRVPVPSESVAAVAAWVGRWGQYELLTAMGRAAMAKEGMVERQSGEVTANDERVED
jgi:hypothetical protein